MGIPGEIATAPLEMTTLEPMGEFGIFDGNLHTTPVTNKYD